MLGVGVGLGVGLGLGYRVRGPGHPRTFAGNPGHPSRKPPAPCHGIVHSELTHHCGSAKHYPFTCVVPGEQ